MTRYLVDTNVIPTTAPTTPVKRVELSHGWIRGRPTCFCRSITIAEITDGIAKARREGARRKAADLSTWLRAMLHLYGDRVLVFDSPTAEIAGVLSDLARSRGHSPGFADIAIAATALRHDLLSFPAMRAISCRWMSRSSTRCRDFPRSVKISL